MPDAASLTTATCRRKRWLLLFTVLLGSALLRLYIANLATFPGHADHAFYFTVAKNVVAGHGFSIDYIWNYLSHPTNLTHASHDYWMPLPSAVMAAFLWLPGTPLFNALLPSILAGLGICLLTYKLAWQYSKSFTVALTAMTVTAMLPQLFIASVLTDTAIYYAALVMLGLYLLANASSNQNNIIYAACCAGLAHMTRQDGLLLMLPIMLTIAYQPHSHAQRARLMLSAGIAYLLALSPLLLLNLHAYGTALPSWASKTAFATHFEDIYSATKAINLTSYMAWGWHNILASKIDAALSNMRTVIWLLGWPLLITCGLGMTSLAWHRTRHQLATTLPALIYFFLLALFYTLIATLPSMQGGFMRSALSVMPILIIIATELMHRMLPKPVFLAVALGFITVTGLNAMMQAREKISENNSIGHEQQLIGEYLKAHAMVGSKNEIVVMTRNPLWCSSARATASVVVPMFRISEQSCGTWVATLRAMRALPSAFRLSRWR